MSHAFGRDPRVQPRPRGGHDNFEFLCRCFGRGELGALAATRPATARAWCEGELAKAASGGNATHVLLLPRFTRRSAALVSGPTMPHRRDNSMPPAVLPHIAKVSVMPHTYATNGVSIQERRIRIPATSTRSSSTRRRVRKRCRVRIPPSSDAHPLSPAERWLARTLRRRIGHPGLAFHVACTRSPVFVSICRDRGRRDGPWFFHLGPDGWEGAATHGVSEDGLRVVCQTRPSQANACLRPDAEGRPKPLHQRLGLTVLQDTARGWTRRQLPTPGSAASDVRALAPAAMSSAYARTRSAAGPSSEQSRRGCSANANNKDDSGSPCRMPVRIEEPARRSPLNCISQPWCA